MNEATFESEIRYTFLAETSEMLEDIENIFMQLENNPQDFSKMPKLLRIMHTIKGSSATVGYHEIANFTHKFETLLVGIRDGKIDTTQEIIELLLEGNDCLKQAVSILHKNLKAILIHLTKTENKIDAILEEKLNKKIENNKYENKITTEFIPKVSQSKNNENKKGSILVCDDDNELLESIQEMLQNENYYVTTCDHAATALEILKTQNIDVIMTDLKMPGIDGLEFTQKVRNINIYIPIVFVSGNISREHVQKFLRFGVIDFIDKPFTIDSILLVIGRAMRSKNLWNELITISKSCFKIFVFIQKIDSLISDKNPEFEHSKERELLKECLAEIQQTTARLLAAEKNSQQSYSKENLK
ncbi:response regulator [Fluviispira multicolorata]|uniref:Response regulator n=1 Tax=Fluviispira multicolorata TaxID=2654512 RepID=A0A833N0Z6_9BACT|nr:response regulator [Fluviispira multicolorata]KAB8029775.1 response regulator [Fluviispira multicolorata]